MQLFCRDWVRTVEARCIPRTTCNACSGASTTVHDTSSKGLEQFQMVYRDVSESVIPTEAKRSGGILCLPLYSYGKATTRFLDSRRKASLARNDVRLAGCSISETVPALLALRSKPDVPDRGNRSYRLGNRSEDYENRKWEPNSSLCGAAGGNGFVVAADAGARLGGAGRRCDIGRGRPAADEGYEEHRRAGGGLEIYRARDHHTLWHGGARICFSGWEGVRSGMARTVPAELPADCWATATRSLPRARSRPEAGRSGTRAMRR